MTTTTWTKTKIDPLVRRAGSKTKAALLILEALQCSFSKAEKIVSGRYPSRLSHSEEEKLIRLLNRPEISPQAG